MKNMFKQNVKTAADCCKGSACTKLVMQNTRVDSACRRRKLRGTFNKFCNSTIGEIKICIKKNRNVANYTLFFNIISTEFNAFATYF